MFWEERDVGSGLEIIEDQSSRNVSRYDFAITLVVLHQVYHK